MSHASRIQKAGFRLESDGANLIVEPFSKLTPKQRDYLKRHKAEIIAELQSTDADKTDGQKYSEPAAAAIFDQASAETLMDILARACEGLELTVDDLWRRLSEDDIEAIRENPEAEWPALRCCAEIWNSKCYETVTESNRGES